MMPDTLSREEWRDRIVGAMPWYDESNPDYTELDKVLDDMIAAHIDALTAAVEALPFVADTESSGWLSRAAVLAILRGEQP